RFMCCNEHVVTVSPNANEFVDIEESAVIDGVRGFPPKREPVRLRGDQPVEVLECADFRRLRYPYRKFVIEILKVRGAVVSFYRDLAGFQTFAVRLVEDRKNDLVRTPIDVEETGESGRGAIDENIRPPWVFRACRHMVRHDIEDQPHPSRFDLCREPSELFAR